VHARLPTLSLLLISRAARLAVGSARAAAAGWEQISVSYRLRDHKCGRAVRARRDRRVDMGRRPLDWRRRSAKVGAAELDGASASARSSPFGRRCR
jgi:hypothetical protein